MPTILCAMPENTYRRMMTPELEAELRALGEVIYCPNAREMSEEEYGALWAKADAALTGWGVRPPTPAMLDRAPNLRIISHTAGSLRMFPRYALEKGIVITTARAAIARTVAEFCLMNACILLRRYLYYLDSDPARKAFFSPEGSTPYNETLHDKTVGLIGFGCIGRLFREKLRPFDCRVLVHDPYMTPEEAARHQVELTDLPTLLRTSKVVSLHAPDIPQTRHMIGAQELALLQDGAIFLNSARGRLVDTEALTEALRTGRFFAAIDVTDPEPLPPDHPLPKLPNVLFTPHVAGPTQDEYPQLTRMALTDLARFLRGERPLYAITPEAFDLMSF
ncbi:MAG TPA: hydroxyacid dehydrogenase [Chthonomonadaceae bacterium]|nr:hydroxyacid dehydrogenase [Chthonomonadaceae bacterium]